MKITKKCLVFAMAMLCSVSTSALAVEYDIEKDFSSGEIRISGNAAEGDTIVFEIVSAQQDPKTVWEDSAKTNYKVNAVNSSLTFDAQYSKPFNVLKYFNTLKVDNGCFDAVVKLKETGDYRIAVYDSSSEKISEPFRYTIFADYSEIIEVLNGLLQSGTEDEFKDILSDEIIKYLGWDQALSDKNEVLSVLYNSMKGKAFDENKYKENNIILESAVVSHKLNKGTIANAANYLKNAAKNDELLTKYFDKFINTPEKEAYLTKKLYNKSIKTINDDDSNTVSLISELRKAMILTVVKYNDGYTNIEKLFNDYKDVLGLTSVSNNSSVWKNLAGADKNSIEELMSTYNDLLKSSQSNANNGGSSSGGSSGGGSSSGNKTNYAVGVSQNVISAPKEIHIDIFTDIENVPWAREAIVELTAAGVISGKDSEHFCPNDNITREEFTKLIAAAFLKNQPESTLTFKDVLTDKWYYKYIAQAKNAGLIGGYSEDTFGVGVLITRQDMAQIIYNTAKFKGLDVAEVNEYTQKFADDDLISDYAKEAVYSLQEMGIISGVGDMSYAPKNHATRAQAAVIIYRLLLK